MDESAGSCTRRSITPHSQPMTNTERVEAIARLAEQLAALTTAEERALFPFLDHLTDLIDELEADE